MHPPQAESQTAPDAEFDAIGGRALRGAPVRITRLDRGNRHLFQPLPWLVATAGLFAPEIAARLRQILRGQPMSPLRAVVSGARPRFSACRRPR